MQLTSQFFGNDFLLFIRLVPARLFELFRLGSAPTRGGESLKRWLLGLIGLLKLGPELFLKCRPIVPGVFLKILFCFFLIGRIGGLFAAEDFLGGEGVSVVVVPPPLLMLLLLLARLGFSHSTIHPYFSSAYLKGRTLIIFYLRGVNYKYPLPSG